MFFGASLSLPLTGALKKERCDLDLQDIVATTQQNETRGEATFLITRAWLVNGDMIHQGNLPRTQDGILMFSSKNSPDDSREDLSTPRANDLYHLARRNAMAGGPFMTALVGSWRK